MVQAVELSPAPLTLLTVSEASRLLDGVDQEPGGPPVSPSGVFAPVLSAPLASTYSFDDSEEKVSEDRVSLLCVVV